MAARLREDFGRLKVDRERLQHLAAEVAHEMKTPIASLRLYHELLLDGEHEGPETRQELLRRGAAQVNRLEYLADFLVDMARLEANTGPSDREEIDLATLARQTANTWESLMAQQGVSLAVSLPEGPVRVLANPQRLGQALDNLLQNALRVSEKEAQVHLRLTCSAGWAVLSVADQGPGIPAEMMPRLFEPFVKGPGSVGMGVGLALVRAVANAYGGDVSAANRPEGGAEFTLTLPVHL